MHVDLTELLSTQSLKLTGGPQGTGRGQEGMGWSDVVNVVIQRTLTTLADHEDPTSRELEGSLFLKHLHQTAAELRTQIPLIGAELVVFAAPLGIYSFRLLGRRYVCLGETPPHAGGQDNDQITPLHAAIMELTRHVSSISVDLTDRPTHRELQSILIDHIQESIRDSSSMQEQRQEQKTALDWSLTQSETARWENRPKKARIAAIRNWEERMIMYQREDFEHPVEESDWFAFPYLALDSPDNKHIVLTIVSPLDPLFTDDKVPHQDRAPEITMAIFSTSSVVPGGRLKYIEGLLQQGVARVLFTNLLNQHGQVQADSGSERTKILRHWVKVSSKGLRGLLSDQEIKVPFDPILVCERIVRRVLCAKVDGVVDTETFPFDRAFIFAESGTSNEISNKPMRVRVLEASVLSNAPADRGRYLTSRERRVRGTAEFQCDLSEKIIEEDGSFTFSIHQGEGGTLILAEGEELDFGSPGEPAQPQDGHAGQQRPGREQDGYKISLPDRIEDVEQRDHAAATFNLMGRLLSEFHERTDVGAAQDAAEGDGSGKRFTEEFERLRLKVAQKADSSGLLFLHDHGLSLARDNVMLDKIQKAYFEYLADRFQARDEQFLREVQRRPAGSRKETEPSAAGATTEDGGSEDRDAAIAQGAGTSRVVFVSFASDLHDENVRHWVERLEEVDHSSSRGSADARPVLGAHYAFTLILVSDQDPVKSTTLLQAERDDLRLFFELMLSGLWQEKSGEFNYLAKRSKSFGAAMNQFVHWAKSKMPDAQDKQEADRLIKDLRSFVRPGRPDLRREAIAGPGEVLGCLVEGQQDRGEIQGALEEQARRFTVACGAKCVPEISIVPSHLPNLEVMWSRVVFADALRIAFKNAVEASALASEGARYVSLEVCAAPKSMVSDRRDWYLDVLIENTGGPIPSDVLEKLNEAAPEPMGADSGRKPGSTGVGVWLARTQLLEVIGMGADIMYSNVRDGAVQTRVRVPARLRISSAPGVGAVSSTEAPDGAYLLYVEDNQNTAEGALEILRDLGREVGFEVVHCNGAVKASRLMRQRLPMALMTDLNIRRGETDLVANRKFGFAVIREFLSLAVRANATPPLFILSNEPPQDIASEITGGGFAVKRWKGLELASLLRDPKRAWGSRCILNGKTLPDGLLPVMQEIHAAWVANGKDGVGSAVSIARVARKQDALEVALDDVAQIVADATMSPVTVLIVREDSKSEQALQRALTKWFAHAGIPDRDPLLGEQGPTFPLWNSVQHHKLLMALTVPRSLWNRMPPRLIYWALMRNVVIESAGSDVAMLAEDWSRCPQEGRGYLSRIRHDVKNLWQNGESASHLHQVLEEITSLEKILLLPHDARDQLEARFREGRQEATGFLHELLARSASVADDREKVRQHLVRLREYLRAGYASSRRSDADADFHLGLVAFLQRYVGAVR